MVDGKPQGPAQLVKTDVTGAGLRGFTADGSYYHTIWKGDSDVYVATLDFDTGTVLSPPEKLVERFEGHNRTPVWSPDGGSVAYVSWGDSPAAATPSTMLAIRSLDSGEEQVHVPQIRGLFAGLRTAPRWSPDGRSILAWGNPRQSDGVLHVIDVKSGAVVRVIEDEHGISYSQPAWSPDGRTVFYLRPSLSSTERPIIAHDLESGRKTELHSGQVMAMDLSPDGRQLAFVEQIGPSSDRSYRLMVVPASGGEAREIHSLKNGRRGFAYTPDGRYLLFGRGEDYESPVELWRISVDGGEPRKLDLEIEGLMTLSIHPDGRRIAFSSGGGGSEVWVMHNLLAASRGSNDAVR